jgi:hypothetical protein
MDLERCADVALAVTRLAVRDAAAGDEQAAAWIDQVRGDVLGQAPEWAARAWAGAVEPGELLAEAYRARKAAGVSFGDASAELGGTAAQAHAWWRGQQPAQCPSAWPPWAEPFLRAVATGLSQADAARSVGCKPASPYGLARRSPGFEAALARALAGVAPSDASARASASSLRDANGWPLWAAPFLEAVARGLAPKAAANAAGRPHSAPHDLARRDTDFAEAWARARAAGELRRS